ncbi:1,4-dihydroxy-2-naphthoate polyprenyltransferase [uncultured Friedmanniella sp.]|uniref:1,4-dihydroxy-2-naphthoate polyprenyltransferase n=1 Tax=uncultured Friedmanniella sp. TaxID=335381 RepID=UPI0035CB6C4C
MTLEAALHPTASQWLAGSRPRTLPAAASPVLAATGLAYAGGGFSPVAALLALVVALALQVGVNYANDYSDGVRGTDANRVGPLRLVGSGVARPGAVKRAAFGAFGLAGLAGLGLVLLTGHWWLLAVGAVCVLAAWSYTGGRRPYGYRGLGEVAVFVFFGLVAVSGTVYVQLGRVTTATVLTGAWVGALACALLVANNLRDLRGDTAAGKRTLATRLGDRGTRLFYVGLVAGAAVLIVVVALLTSLWALLGLAGLALAVPACRRVLAGAAGRELIAVLKNTGTTELLAAVGFTLGLVLGHL